MMDWELQNEVEQLLGKKGADLEPAVRDHALALLVPQLLDEAKKLSKEIRPYRNFANLVGPEARLYDNGQWLRKVENAAEQPVWSHCGSPKKLNESLKAAIALALKPDV